MVTRDYAKYLLNSSIFLLLLLCPPGTHLAVMAVSFIASYWIFCNDLSEAVLVVCSSEQRSHT